MNKKQTTIDLIMGEVLKCCNVLGADDITCEIVRSKCKCENVVMTRCIFVTQMLYMGYSRTTMAAYLGRSVKSIGNIMKEADKYTRTSRAYQIACAEATLAVKDLNIG